MFGDARCHQVGELSGLLPNRQRATLGQEIEDVPTRRVGQDPEQGVTIAGHHLRSPDRPNDRELGERRHRAHNPAPFQPSPNALGPRIHRE